MDPHMDIHMGISIWRSPWGFPQKSCGNGMGVGVEIPFPQQPWVPVMKKKMKYYFMDFYNASCVELILYIVLKLMTNFLTNFSPVED